MNELVFFRMNFGRQIRRRWALAGASVNNTHVCAIIMECHTERKLHGMSTPFTCRTTTKSWIWRILIILNQSKSIFRESSKTFFFKSFTSQLRDLMAIVSVLEYNTFFRGLKIKQTKVSNETLDRILHVLKRSMWLEELHLEALGLKSDFIHKLALSVMSNKNSALRTIDLSHNPIEDKGESKILFFLIFFLSLIPIPVHILINCLVRYKILNSLKILAINSSSTFFWAIGHF